MEIYCYIMSLMLSILTLISTIIIEYKEIVYDEITMFGIKEIIICMIASIILMAIGLVIDTRERREKL